jgi:hypothetical protein
MTAWRRVIELSISDADVAKLMSIARSRTEPASRVERARILLGYREDPSFFAVARALGLHHQTVQRCGCHLRSRLQSRHRGQLGLVRK